MGIQTAYPRPPDPHAIATASLLGAMQALVRELALSGSIDPARFSSALDELHAQSHSEVSVKAEAAMAAMVINVLKEAASEGAQR